MSKTTLDSTEQKEKTNPLSIIRTETALSRFPFHRLAKKGLVQIEIKNRVSALLWEVTYNSKYGQPGPLAYKLDTLVINRRIEEQGRPVPTVIKLGSLAQIAAELGLNRDTNSVKTALLQNAFAAVNAKISYRSVDRSERTLEAAFTRYAVVLTGERLPDGGLADAVHLVLHPIYADVLNAAVTRPLNYDYMKTLPPAAQRFYEVVSYQIYAALYFQNERARLRYSDYCLLSTATRYFDFDHVKKQMYKVHKPHLDSGYLAKASYEETTDDIHQPDWWMYYIPGPSASREYKQFTGTTRKARGGKEAQKKLAEGSKNIFPQFVESELPKTNVISVAVSMPSEPSLEETKLLGLIERLTASDLNRADAERFARERLEECERQLSYLPFVTEFKISRGAYLRRAIEQGFAPPPGFIKQQREQEQKRQREETTQLRKAQEEAQEARRREEATQLDKAMAQLKKDAPESFLAFRTYLAAERGKVERKCASMPGSISTRMLQLFDAAERQRELFREWQKLVDLSSNNQLSSPTVVLDVPASASDLLTPLQAADDEHPEAIRAMVIASLGRAAEQ